MILLLLSAIIPVAVFLYCIYRKDTEKEPLKLLVKCFLWGCAVTVPVILVELSLNFGNPVITSLFPNAFYDAFIVASLVEEAAKFLCLYLIIWKHKEFDQYFDGIIYAVFVSLGFAMVENILYMLDGGLGRAVARAILAVPMHGLCGVMMGYFFSLARFSSIDKRTKLLWYSFLVPFSFHGLYDFCIMYFIPQIEINEGMAGLFLLAFSGVVISIWRIGLKNIKKHLAQDTGKNR
ncbi:MAG: PrsW family intramembrane metalloprotease [Prevotellaceae bacterium]|jgi:RsiW-degrading membrane proteinase PrsW (M82 family)|nr:PrsW family intramembrane metalloprotease [Prevotellaceae bacterium]